MRNGSRWMWIVAGMVALAATPALAQEGQDHEEGQEQSAGHRHDRDKRIEMLREALDLTDAQVTEVREIFAEQAEKHRDLRESEDLAGLRALREETHDRLLAVLDDAQRAKLGDLKEHRGEGHQERDGEGGHQEGHGAES